MMANFSITTSQNQKPSTIRISGLTKSYDKLTAVDEVNLEVQEGEIFGLLGPNGAGKTTLINMLTTLLRPTEGTAAVMGFDIERQADKIREEIGVVFQNTVLEDDLTAKETLDIHARLYGVTKRDREKRVNDLLLLFHLEERKNDLVGNFSGGMKRRLEIAKGILHGPKVLFLDEPTVGLDPQSREVIWDYIEKINHVDGMTILLTTHYLEEADRLCDRVGLIDHGRILALGTPKSLKESISNKEVIEVELESPNDGSIQKLRSSGLTEDISLNGSVLRITMKKNSKNLIQIIKWIFDEELEVRSIRSIETTLNDVFLYFTGYEIRD